MANKYVKSTYTPHHCHNVSIHVETKYVQIVKEGAKGTAHAYTSVQTRTKPKKPGDAKRPQDIRRRRQGQGETWYETRAPAPPTQYAHTLPIGDAQGMTMRGCTRYGKYVTAQKKKDKREKKGEV